MNLKTKSEGWLRIKRAEAQRGILRAKNPNSDSYRMSEQTLKAINEELKRRFGDVN